MLTELVEIYFLLEHSPQMTLTNNNLYNNQTLIVNTHFINVFSNSPLTSCERLHVSDHPVLQIMNAHRKNFQMKHFQTWKVFFCKFQSFFAI